LVQVIKEISASTTSKPERPEFSFVLTREAAEYNARVREKYGNDLERAIQAQTRSPVGYVAEFLPREQFVKLFGLHPCWSRMESILTYGFFGHWKTWMRNKGNWILKKHWLFATTKELRSIPLTFRN
jgi:hypothetical protein